MTVTAVHKDADTRTMTITAEFDAPLRSGDARFIHGDLGAEHILAADDGTLTGVIDWDAAIGDPARDLGRLCRDLGVDVAGRIAALVPLDDDGLVERATFHARCALLEDLADGVESGDDRHVAAALGSVGQTFRR